jgi:hypothetical protein
LTGRNTAKACEVFSYQPALRSSASSEAALTQKAAAIGQHWLRGINTARSLKS